MAACACASNQPHLHVQHGVCAWLAHQALHQREMVLAVPQPHPQAAHQADGLPPRVRVLCSRAQGRGRWAATRRDAK